MSEKHLLKAVKGVFLFTAFMIMAFSIPDVNLLTLSYLQNLGINPRLFQFMFTISAVVNLVIGLRGAKWNAIWFTVWVMYSVSSLAAYLSGASIPLLAVCAYLLLSVFLTLEVLEDADLFKYIGHRLWKKEL